jgi:hypothetical protein
MERKRPSAFRLFRFPLRNESMVDRACAFLVDVHASTPLTKIQHCLVIHLDFHDSYRPKAFAIARQVLLAFLGWPSSLYNTASGSWFYPLAERRKCSKRPFRNVAVSPIAQYYLEKQYLGELCQADRWKRSNARFRHFKPRL